MREQRVDDRANYDERDGQGERAELTLKTPERSRGAPNPDVVAALVGHGAS